MKLVELLARELSEWPDACKTMTQDGDGDVNMYEGMNPKTTSSGRVWLDDEFIDYAKRSDEVAEDQATAVVTRAQWQAERDKQKGGEWKRHRGGKQPIPDGVAIEVRWRDGEIGTKRSEIVRWEHEQKGYDIMAYKVISQPQAEEVEVKVDAEGYRGPFPTAPEGEAVNSIEWDIIFPSGVCSVEAKTEQFDGPLAWRDTIIHCQAIIEDCERDIERNTQQLADEGFLLIAPITDVCAVDMNDWRNWKDGDKIRMTADDWCDLSKGEVYEIIDKGRDYITILDDVDYRRKLDVDGETMFDDGRLVDFEFVSSP